MFIEVIINTVFMHAVISNWLSLEEIIFKPENETTYSTNDHF